MQNQKLAFADRKLGVGAALVIRELDFEDARGENFDDGPDLTAQQAPLWQVRGEGHDIEHSNGLVLWRHATVPTARNNL